MKYILIGILLFIVICLILLVIYFSQQPQQDLVETYASCDCEHGFKGQKRPPFEYTWTACRCPT